ncbi:MAG: prolyl oligopeptidase family serine peptidase [Planctomycetota bacterium]|nr:prolyl oligopeptidase family serine peptidase [Planctomycetota bacterium]
MTEQTFRGAGGVDLAYRWLAPKALKPGEKYPLVLCLHGAGGGSEAAKVLAETPMQEKFPCFVMAPKFGADELWAFPDTPAMKEKLGRMGKKVERLAQVIEALKEKLAREPIDPARVYVTGQSMGGMGAWGAAARHPELFAAAVPICGAWSTEDAERLAKVPIWAFHGEKDGVVPVTYSRDLKAALEKAGGAVKYTEYPGVEHNSWSQAYATAELWAWLFEQRKK